MSPAVELSALVLLTACLQSSGVAAQEKYCLSKDTNPYLFYSTKTAYYFVYGRKEFPVPVPNCEPVHLWLLARHGTRYAGTKALQRYHDLGPIRDQVLEAHSKYKRGELCWEDQEALRKWKATEVPSSQADMLTPQGYQDMEFMARRFKTYFPQIFGPSYTPEKYLIRYAESNRTRDSAKAFADGLFGKEAGIDIPEKYQDDALLMPNRNCSAMERARKDPKNTLEADKFKEGPLMTQMADRVSKRFGYTTQQKMDLVLQMYDACRFNKAWNISNVSAWCSGFHEEDLELIEYYEDLKKYYQSGYGNTLTTMVGCPIVKDMLDTFKKVADNKMDDAKSQAQSVLYFVHSVMIRAVLTRLGMAFDEGERPDHTNYDKMGHRLWRTSLISPFAANLAAVFYKCRGTGEVNKVMFYLNEKRVDLEGCRVGLCDWSQIYYRFNSVVSDDSCSYDFCARDFSAASLPLAGFWLVLIAALAAVNVRAMAG